MKLLFPADRKRQQTAAKRTADSRWSGEPTPAPEASFNLEPDVKDHKRFKKLWKEQTKALENFDSDEVNIDKMTFPVV